MAGPEHDQQSTNKARVEERRAPPERSAPTKSALVTRIQRGAGNSAAALLVQRWKKGIVGAPPEIQPDDGAKTWAVGVAGEAAQVEGGNAGDDGAKLPDGGGPVIGRGRSDAVSGAPKPSPWAKTAPTTAPPKGPPIGAGRDPLVQAKRQLQAQAWAAQAAAAQAREAVLWARGQGAAAQKLREEAATQKAAVGVELVAAKGLWGDDAPGKGKAAAERAEAIDPLVGKVAAAEVEVTKAFDKLAPALSNAPITKGLNQITLISDRLARLEKSLPADEGVKAAAAAARLQVDQARTSVENHRKHTDMERNRTKAELVALGKLHTQAKADQAAAWQPLKVAGGPAVIVGRLQQQLNAKHPKGKDRISVTALFNALTETRLREYQGGGSGIADSATMAKLDVDAPAVRQSGQWVVLSPEGANFFENSFKGDPSGFEGADRPWVVPAGFHPSWIPQKQSEGPAVVEVQQRIKQWRPTLGWWDRLRLPAASSSGRYDAATGELIKFFQKQHSLAATGEVKQNDWKALDAWGVVTEGQAMYSGTNETEGQDRGGLSTYRWKVEGGQLRITVRINFVQKDPATLDILDPQGGPAHARDAQGKVTGASAAALRAATAAAIPRFTNDITRVWGGFKAKQVGVTPPQPEADVVFDPAVVSGSGDATVNVIPAPTADNPGGRSDSGNWWASDNDPALAGHEFGHLIGLPDEYGAREQHFIRLSGTEANIGTVSPPKFKRKDHVWHATQIANAVAAATPAASAAVDPADPASKTAIQAARGKAQAFTNAVGDLGLWGYHVGAFARQVSEAFATAASCTPVSGGLDIPSFAVALVPAGLDRSLPKVQPAIWDVQSAYEDGVRPFLSSNETLLATSGTVTPRGQQLPAGHDHPVQSRHVQPYLKHLVAARGGQWEVYRP